jgi:cation/acetate symporter
VTVSAMLPLAASATAGHRTLFLALSIVVTVTTLGITLWARHSTHTPAEFYTGGREFFPGQNGLALSGDFMSAASVLGIVGSMSLHGLDGFLYAIGFLLGWLGTITSSEEPDPENTRNRRFARSPAQARIDVS